MAPVDVIDATTEMEGLRHRIDELLAENARLVEEVSARDGFLAVAAHELRNALTPVVARVDRLRHRMTSWSPAKIEDNLAQIEHATALFARRAATLLDVSRMASGQLELTRVPVAIGPVVRVVCEAYGPLAERAGCTLAVELPETDLVILGDELALEQIVDNLVSNAIKYGGGTPVVVSAGIEAHPTAAGSVARLTVTDGGPGISPDDQARIFERFERAVRKDEAAAGFGVGLWVVRQLCEALGGRIDVFSSPGAGSTFRITLPLHVAKDPA